MALVSVGIRDGVGRSDSIGVRRGTAMAGVHLGMAAVGVRLGTDITIGGRAPTIVTGDILTIMAGIIITVAVVATMQIVNLPIEHLIIGIADALPSRATPVDVYIPDVQRADAQRPLGVMERLDAQQTTGERLIAHRVQELRISAPLVLSTGPRHHVHNPIAGRLRADPKIEVKEL